MDDRSKEQTSEESVKNMLDEETTVVNLDLAIKKEEFKNNQKTRPELREKWKFTFKT